MSEPKLISPILDNFEMGEPISEHNGVRCCPAIEKDTEDKYIVKIISIPASQTQLDALLLSGAYQDQSGALAYFESLANGILEEVQILQTLSQLEGFAPVKGCQKELMENDVGFDVYVLSKYRKTLQHHFRCSAMTHLGALNLGLDLCATLAVCRRSGYMYVDLKPENIYITDENGFQIGDIGFLKLDSLKYASLPDRYHNQYTAPEISDAFCTLNTTIDVYAIGLILYQAFNDGKLPFNSDTAPAEDFPPPAYADYEMAEIILKACAADPSQRWKDPVEMGQALVSYMQRNGAHDNPIIPVPTEVINSVPDEPEVQDGAYISVTDDRSLEEGTADLIDDTSSADHEIVQISDESVSEDAIYVEDDDGNLTFLDASEYEEVDLDSSEINYENVSDELSNMLSQADELIAHPTPDPVVQPDPVDVQPPPLPDIITSVDKTQEDSENTKESNEVLSEENEEDNQAIAMEDDITSDEDEQDDTPTRSGHWVRNTLLCVLAAAILVAGFFFYKNYYLQPIDSIMLEEHDNGDLTVLVTSKIDESKLTVICSDTYGNQLNSDVQNGKAFFTGLAPDSAYTVKIAVDGFHRLTGDTSAAFTTPVQTNIVQFHAVTGSEDGSVVLGFTIDGPDADHWKIHYRCEGEAEKEVVFTGHMVTLTGLTVGNTYSFTLTPDSDLQFTGENEINHTASKIIKAVDLSITGCINNTLTAAWSAPEGISVESWTVRCYSESGYDETIVVNNTSAAFEGTDPSADYTVEVTAAGMSVSERAYAAADSITVTDFSVDDSNPNQLKLSWNTVGSAPQGGWLLQYSINGSAAYEVPCESGNTVTLTTKIPGVAYKFTLQTTDGSAVLGGNLSHSSPAAKNFSGYGVTSEHMEFKMCKTPSNKKWDRYDLSKSDYTTSFSVGQKISFLVRLRHEYSTSSDKITTLFVISDDKGTIVNTSTLSSTWTKMWYRNYCELDLPSVPQAPGKYTVSVYFNGCLANEQTFTITD